MRWFFWVLCLWFCHALPAQTQSDSTLYRFETIDGNEYIGQIISQDETFLLVRTETLGVIQIRKATVRRTTPVLHRQVKNGVYWFENPQSTRYFWQANGYGLKKGEGYYQNVWILFNQFTYGITDNFQLGAGLLPTFLFGTGYVPVWLTPKISIPVSRDKFNLGVGALLGTVIGDTDATYGILYGSATLGSRDKNMSLGLGYGYAGADFAKSPAITLSGMLRTGQRGYLITENYFVSTSDGDGFLLFFGGRRLIKNSGLDFGLMFPSGTDGQLVAIPWLGLTIPFGK